MRMDKKVPLKYKGAAQKLDIIADYKILMTYQVHFHRGGWIGHRWEVMMKAGKAHGDGE